MIIAIIDHERGIPSKCESSARVDYVPALCTHRPSLLPIERFSENPGFDLLGLTLKVLSKKSFKLERLEEVKVVTRFP